MNCLRCSLELFQVNLRNTSVYSCNQCKGVLIPHASAVSIFSGYEIQDIGTLFTLLDAQGCSGDRKNCTLCNKNNLCMHKIRDIELDYCHNCKAIWFDPGELDDIGEVLLPVPPATSTLYGISPIELLNYGWPLYCLAVLFYEVSCWWKSITIKGRASRARERSS